MRARVIAHLQLDMIYTFESLACFQQLVWRDLAPRDGDAHESESHCDEDRQLEGRAARRVREVPPGAHEVARTLPRSAGACACSTKHNCVFVSVTVRTSIYFVTPCAEWLWLSSRASSYSCHPLLLVSGTMFPGRCGLFDIKCF